MAQKKEEGLKYLQMPLPQGRAAYKSVKVNWSGLNLSDDYDTGSLSKESNISTEDAPHLVPSKKSKSLIDVLNLFESVSPPVNLQVLSLYGFDDYLVVIHSENYHIYATYIKTEGNNYGDRFICKLNPNVISIYDAYERDIVQFNVYDSPTDVVSGQYVKKLLVFPDKLSMPVISDIVKVNKGTNYSEVTGSFETGLIKVNGDFNNEEDRPALPVSGKLYHFSENFGKYYMYATDEWDDVSTNGKYKFTDGTNIKWYVPIGDNLIEVDTRKMYCFTGGLTDIKLFTYYKYNGTDWVASGNTGYFVPDAMDVVIKTYTNSDAETHYFPPDSASHNYYWHNLSEAAQEADTLYGKAIYRWVDDADSAKSGWKICAPPNMPPIKHACVHLSRLFGVDDDRIYASGFNDYTNWNLDTAEEYNESNAWCSPAQSNTKADSKFTGITAFENHVICFKRDFMHEIYNTKNPFRVQDIYEEGTIDNRTIQNVDGKLIFVSSDGVKIYTGGNPRIISANLDIDEFIYAVSGTDGRFYYLYCDNDDGVSPVRRLLVFDTYVGQWSEREIGTRIKNFANTKDGTYMLCEAQGNTPPKVYKLNANGYSSQQWSFETDLITRQGSTPTVDIKHIKKIQMLADFDGNTSNSASLKIYALYDGEAYNASTSQLLYDSNLVSTKKTVPIRVKARKSAHYSLKLHFEGVGYVKIYEMELFFEQGGDLYV